MKRVLIVDDAVFMRFSLRTMLEKNGFEVAGEAGNGLQAIEMYQKLKPDIVTMDITMPEMTGIDAVKAIRSVDPTAKIIMITALGQEPYIMEAILAGAKGFIVKPFQEERVIKELSVL